MPNRSKTSVTIWLSAGWVLALLLVGGRMPAQRPSSWQSTTVAGGANPGSVSEHGKLIQFISGGKLHVFSAFTRCWHVTPVSSSAIITPANDWLLVEETSRFVAFSSLGGMFKSLEVSKSAALVNPPSQRNDSIALVRDGSTLYAFSGFTGRWVSLTVSPSANVVVQRHVALVVDGPLIYAMSAFEGLWVSSGIHASVRWQHADGTIAVVQTTQLVHAFSARTARWSTAPALGPAATMATARDVVVWSDGLQTLGFSGPRGRFATQLTGRATQLVADQQLAAATAGNSAWFFSAATARWTPYSTSGPWTLTTSAAVALMVEPNAVHAYSSITDSVASSALAATFSEVNWTVAAVVDSTAQRVEMFSAYTGQWTQPPGVAMGAFPLTVLNGAMIETTSGVVAFSARSGSYIGLTTAGSPVLHNDLNSSVLIVEEANQFSVFEPRREVWLTQPRAAQGPITFYIWRTTMLALEPGWAYGYGTQAGEIEAYPLTESPVDQGTSSESARVVTANLVIGFSPVPDLTTLAQFPEFRRMFCPGVPLHLHLRGPARSTGLAALGVPATAKLLTPVGGFLLNSGLAPLATFPMGPIEGDGSVSVRIFVPDVAALTGLQLGFQAVVVPVSGTAYLTHLCGVHLH